MKKRILSILIVLLIVACIGVQMIPTAQATDAAYQSLVNFILQEGNQGSWYYYSKKTVLKETEWMQEQYLFTMVYNPGGDCIEIRQDYILLPGIQFGLQMQLYSDGTKNNYYLSYLLSGEAHYNIQPASFSLSTQLTAYEYWNVDSSERSRCDQMASTLMKQMLENLQTILKKSGKTISALGFTKYAAGHSHSWNNGAVTVPATCACGEKEYACNSCKGIRLEVTAPIAGHTWNDWEIGNAPTCTEEGYRTRTCQSCGMLDNEPVNALGHAWTFAEVVYQSEEDSLHDCTGKYICSRLCGAAQEDRLCAGVIFTDMPDDDNWAHDPIDWAYFSGITDGVADNLFGLNQTCTRAQVVTFLWRAAGEPEPEEAENPFGDVPEDSWFYKPVMWAVQNGITDGVSETSFAPSQSCTRSQVVTFLWRAAGEPEPEEADNPFTDVPEDGWFYKPVLWALQNGVTDGMSDTLFGSGQPCTRAQVVTFLYRCKDLQPPAPEPAPDPEPDPDPTTVPEP